MFPARLELATFRVWGGRDNHYTTETGVSSQCLYRVDTHGSRQRRWIRSTRVINHKNEKKFQDICTFGFNVWPTLFQQISVHENFRKIPSDWARKVVTTWFPGIFASYFQESPGNEVEAASFFWPCFVLYFEQFWTTCLPWLQHLILRNVHRSKLKPTWAFELVSFGCQVKYYIATQGIRT